MLVHSKVGTFSCNLGWVWEGGGTSQSTYTTSIPLEQQRKQTYGCNRRRIFLPSRRAFISSMDIVPPAGPEGLGLTCPPESPGCEPLPLPPPPPPAMETAILFSFIFQSRPRAGKGRCRVGKTVHDNCAMEKQGLTDLNRVWKDQRPSRGPVVKGEEKSKRRQGGIPNNGTGVRVVMRMCCTKL